MINLRIAGDPVPWQVWARRGAPPPGFLAMQAWQEQIQMALKVEVARLRLVDAPVSGLMTLDTTFYLGWPQSAPQRQPGAMERWAVNHLAKKPDIDNIRKAFSDALQGILYINDSQVVGGESFKRYTRQREGYTVMRLQPYEGSVWD